MKRAERQNELLDPHLREYRAAQRRVESGDLGGLSQLEALANRGSAMSMMYIADAARIGKIYVRDYAEAEKWYRHAAALGISDAWQGIGLIHYQNGDFARAAEAFEVGISLDSASSMRLLARMLRAGQGVVMDEGRAIQLLVRAERLGNVWAARDLSRILMGCRFGVLAALKGCLVWLSAVIRVFFWTLLGSNEIKRR